MTISGFYIICGIPMTGYEALKFIHTIPNWSKKYHNMPTIKEIETEMKIQPPIDEDHGDYDGSVAEFIDESRILYYSNHETLVSRELPHDLPSNDGRRYIIGVLIQTVNANPDGQNQLEYFDKLAQKLTTAKEKLAGDKRFEGAKVYQIPNDCKCCS